MKRSEMLDKIEFLLMDLVEDGHFGHPKDLYDPEKKYATIATFIYGCPRYKVMDLIEKELDIKWEGEDGSN